MMSAASGANINTTLYSAQLKQTMEALTTTPCWVPELEELRHTLPQGGSVAPNIDGLKPGASSICKLTTTPCWVPELEELCHTLLQGSSVAPNIDGLKPDASSIRRSTDSEAGNDEQQTVCVTDGFCFIGFAIVNCLIARGYTVRLVLHSQEDIEKAREMDLSGELGTNQVRAVVANPKDVTSLCRAFEGCSGVFHTSALVDPTGVSGYTKHMAKTEARAAERVVEACIQTKTVRKCVFTSSLLACVWRRSSSLNSHLPALVDENCWSDESLCSNKKLWFALGKTMAEKAAWRAARGKKLKLVTICPALITGPGFSHRNLTGSIAFLKGAQEMFMEGILATVDVEKVAKAHVSVYEAMANTACGRYICFDHIIHRCEEIVELQRQLGISNRIATPSAITNTDHPNHFMLSNKKLSRLLSSSRRCSFDTYSILY